MPTTLLPCYSISILNSSLSLSTQRYNIALSTIQWFPLSKTPNIISVALAKSSKTQNFSRSSSIWGGTHTPSCSRNDFYEVSNTHLPGKPQNEKNKDIEELGLLGKPSPIPLIDDSASEVETESRTIDEDEALAPFLKFFKAKDSLEEAENEGGELEATEEQNIEKEDEIVEPKKVSVEYYEPKPGDFVVGVVVSGNENKLDVNVGADLLGTMLTKEVLPLYGKEMDYLLFDVEKDAGDFMVRGRMGIVKNDVAIRGEPVPGRPVVDTGTVLFAEVLGRTLSGRPLLSTRRFFRRLAWHRVRQIKQLNEPFEVRITEWNTGGLLTRIEGLRAFLPKGELMNRITNFTELKEKVGRRIYVQISRMDETKNDLILSEKDAWGILHLQEGTLLQGTVRKIFPYGAQIRIGETNRSGLLHISNITRARVTSVSDLLAVDEKVKVLVIKSMFPDKISFSIADLESEPGLFMSNKEKVFSEAEEMAKKYRQNLPAVLANRKLEPLPDATLFDNEASLYANWKWFKFERDDE